MLPFECIQVLCHGINRCITNFNHLTTVADVINALLDDLSDTQYFSINDCCLYIECEPYLLPLKSTDLIQDILFRYSSSDIHFKLVFKRKKFLRTPLQQSTVINPYEQIRMQELLIQKQQEVINQLTKNNDDNRVSLPTNTRQSRQDEYYQTVNRSLSRVRFRLSSIPRKYEVLSSPTRIVSDVKSILKKSPIQRTSSVDRDIDQLISLKPGENSFCITDDDNSSDQSTTDSCLGSLSSDDSAYQSLTQQHLETLV